MTMTISSATGRKSSRSTLARVAAASIGQSTTQPVTTMLVPVAAMPTSTPNSGPATQPTTRPTTVPMATPISSRLTADSGSMRTRRGRSSRPLSM